MKTIEGSNFKTLFVESQRGGVDICVKGDGIVTLNPDQVPQLIQMLQEELAGRPECKVIDMIPQGPEVMEQHIEEVEQITEDNITPDTLDEIGDF